MVVKCAASEWSENDWKNKIFKNKYALIRKLKLNAC